MREYKSPEAFRQALEARIRAAKPPSINRFRQLLVFDRFLARLQQHFGDDVVVKGGVILELKLKRSRATKDIDLRMTGRPADLLGELVAAGRMDCGDGLRFLITPDKEHPKIQAEGMQYEGFRFRVEARMAEKRYADAFGLDVAFADRLTEKPEIMDGLEFLSFVGVAPTQIRIYPRTTHIAEKLHAYTLPRERPNSRVKDLPDLALLASMGPLEFAKLDAAVKATFDFRGTHELPQKLPPPPEAWALPYERMAKANRLPWATLDEVAKEVERFINLLLNRPEYAGTWDPEKGWGANQMPPYQLTEEEAAFIERGPPEIDRGNFVDGDELLRELSVGDDGEPDE